MSAFAASSVDEVLQVGWAGGVAEMVDGSVDGLALVSEESGRALGATVSVAKYAVAVAHKALGLVGVGVGGALRDTLQRGCVEHQ